MSPNLADVISAQIKESYVLERSGEIGPALQHARQALEKARTSGEKENIASALTCIAYCEQHLGHYEQAYTLAEEATTLTNSKTKTYANALRVQGNCAHETGDLAKADAFYHQAINIAREFGYRSILQSCLHSLSTCVYMPRGQFELALAADDESLRLALELDMPEVAWFPLATMGWVYWITGQRERALAITEKMRGFVQSGSMAEGYYFCLRADLAQDGDDPGAAPALYARARTIAEMIGDPGLNVELRVGLSRYHRTFGNAPTAFNWADDALGIAQRAGSRDLQGWALIERGRAAWEGGDPHQAASDFNAAIDVLTPMDANYDLARANFLLAALLQQAGRSEAESVWHEAVSKIIAGGYAFLLEREQKLAFPLLAHHLTSTNPDVAAISSQLLDNLMGVPPPPLKVYTLGRFDVRQGRRVIPDQAWRQRRAGELFRLLLISPNHSALRYQVFQALWPDKPPRSAQSLFHQATSALRRVLEPNLPDKFPSRYLAVDGGRVTLQLPEGSWVDFETFETHRENRIWETALACYRGNLFPGDLYADWAAARREQLKQQATQVALAAAREGLETGRSRQALNACRRALALEPWQEEAVLLGMRACTALNDRAGAIRLYRQLEHSLRDELDIAPQEDVQAYYRALISP